MKLSIPGFLAIILLGIYFSINITQLILMSAFQFTIILLFTIFIKKDWDNFNLWLKALARDSKKTIYKKRDYPLIDNTILSDTMRLVVELNNNHIKTNNDNTIKNIRYNHIIENYWHPVMVIDKNMNIIYSNKLLRSIFPRAELGTNISAFSRNPKLIPIVEKIFKNKNRSNKKNIAESILISEYDKHKLYEAFPIYISDENYNDKQAEIAFIFKNKEKNKVEEIKTDFIADASHELRTPLTVIKNTNELLKNIDDKKTKAKFLKITNKQINIMKDLLDKLIQLSHIETKIEDEKLLATDIKKIILESINQRKQLVKYNKQTLTFKKSQTAITLADPRDIAIIINNIIDNAIKYSGKYSKIFIYTSIIKNKTNKDMILVKIKDTGIGISEEHIPKLTDRFYRVDKTRSKRDGSSGLGLSIVKSLLDKYDGKLEISSTPGKGTEVSIYLKQNK